MTIENDIEQLKAQKELINQRINELKEEQRRKKLEERKRSFLRIFVDEAITWHATPSVQRRYDGKEKGSYLTLISNDSFIQVLRPIHFLDTFIDYEKALLVRITIEPLLGVATPGRFVGRRIK